MTEPNVQLSIPRNVCAGFYDFECSCVERYPDKGAYRKLAELFRLAAHGTEEERRKALVGIQELVGSELGLAS